MTALPALPSLAEEVVARLRTRRFGRPLLGYDHLPSTNTEALSRAETGAAEGTVVLAEYQTAGRGRHGRSWQANAGQNLMFSVVLRPSLPAVQFGLLTMAAGLAVADAVEATCAPLRAAIKWPNDVLLGDKKCCGMLLESSMYAGTGQQSTVVILGIGLNVNQADFPLDLADRATSLLLETGRPVDRAALLADVLEQLEHRYEALHTDGADAVRAAYRSRLHGLGRTLTLHLPGAGEPIHGTLAGITDTGALCLATPTGLQTFHAGEVTTQRAG